MPSHHVGWWPLGPSHAELAPIGLCRTCKGDRPAGRVVEGRRTRRTTRKVMVIFQDMFSRLVSCNKNFLQRKRSSRVQRPLPPRVTPAQAPVVPLPPLRGGKASVLATRSASELSGRGANWKVASLIVIATCFFFPHLKRGGRSPTDAGHQPPRSAPARAQRSAHAAAFRLSPKGVFHPKDKLQASLGTWCERALPAFACPGPGMSLSPRS